MDDRDEAKSPQPSLSISAFCEIEDYSKTFYYKLKRAGLGPREMRAGGIVRISPEARRDYHRRLEQELGQAEMLRAKARAAAQKAIASPRHVTRRGRK